MSDDQLVRPLPVAEVLSVTATTTTRLVVVRCPICGRKHQHGWPYSLDSIGSRVAHCVGRNVPPGSPGSYYVPTPTGNRYAPTNRPRRRNDR